ncbi:hypothetical protein OE88DRAFT_1330467 [Heliocybe sulcata]|uniref:F-box domain-containing protein n=1 Tax=Heliocybe sulcata TaxID=5364 RepID=A0A5C3N5R2_9AGAM|nr:hypothetical protein OE88DRAFT_1330467 [Heliocybe sulcata]
MELKRSPTKTAIRHPYRSGLAATLPAELICEIAVYFLYDWGTEGLHLLTPGKWRFMLLVCKRWYEALLQDTRLWSVIAIYGIESLRLSLERSRIQPLTIVGTLEVWDAYTELDTIMQNSHRIQSLQIYSISSWVWQKFQMSRTEYAPTSQLQELLIFKATHNGSDDLNRFASEKLRFLELGGFHLEEISAFTSLPFLTSLKLHYNVHWAIALNVKQMLDVLRQTPVLESLTLWVEMRDFPQTIQPPITLRALTSLEFCEMKRADGTLLSMLEFPVLQYLSITVDSDHLRTTIPHVSEVVRQMDRRTPLRGWTLHSPERGDTYCMLTPESNGTTPEKQSRGIKLLFRHFYVKRTDTDCESMIPMELLAHLIPATSSIEHLTLSNTSVAGCETPEAWGNVFRAMPSVKSIEVTKGFLSLLSSGLCVPDLTQDMHLIWDPLFPALERLELRELWFRPQFSKNNELRPGTFMHLLLEPHGSCGDAHKNITVTIDDCVNVVEQDVAEIRKRFTEAEVTWDGVARRAKWAGDVFRSPRNHWDMWFDGM